MPVAYIRNINFYRDGTLVADCNWEPEDESHAKIFDENQPAFITFKQNFDNFTDIEVSAIDSEGRELRIRPAMAHFNKNNY